MRRDNTYLLGNQHAKGHRPNATAFKKGFIPWNKGRKGLHLSPRSEFKKGERPVNWAPIGTIRRRTDQNGKPRQFIKTEQPKPMQWEEYAKWLWKKHYGRLIPGDVVHHLNGVHDDDRIDNLIALPRNEHIIYHNRYGITHIPDTRLDQYRQRYDSTVN